jgi:hypothetical protein
MKKAGLPSVAENKMEECLELQKVPLLKRNTHTELTHEY